MSGQRDAQDTLFAQIDDLEAATKDLTSAVPGQASRVQAAIVDGLNEIRHSIGTIEEPVAPTTDTAIEEIEERG